MLESFWWSCFLVEECGAGHRAYDVDVVTQFPHSLYRYLSHHFAGLATAIMADSTFAEYGDDKRLDRQYFGRALLFDMGVTPSGAHGIIYHKEDAARLLKGLTDFGYFDDRNTEMLPCWRNAAQVRIGTQPSTESEVYVTIYRRPLPSGKGYQALFAVMNESFAPVELPLQLVDAKSLLGGANTLKAEEVRSRTPMPDNLREWWAAARTRDGQAPVLQDVETGDVVAGLPGASETYGPVYVPYHDYRLFLAQHEEGK
jgi:hypothetical protein